MSIMGSLMQRRRLSAVLSVVVVCTATLVAGVPAASAGAAPYRHHLGVRVLTTFRPNVQFAESLARGPNGMLYASVTTFGKNADRGQIWRIDKHGAKTRFGPALRAGAGVLTGVAFDAAGHLYVADATFAKSPAPGVFRVDRAGATRVLSLPSSTFPNGLAFHAGALYITDSLHGSVWRWDPRHQPAPAVQTTAWLTSKKLAPGSGSTGLGPNGIAFRHDSLYVAVADAGLNRAKAPVGRLAAVTLRDRTGRHGPVRVLRTSPLLATADGITFARSGALWIVTNGLYSKKHKPLGGERLVRAGRGGKLHAVAQDTPWMNYPTAVVVGRGQHDHPRLFLENGAFEGGTPNITVLSHR